MVGGRLVKLKLQALLLILLFKSTQCWSSCCCSRTSCHDIQEEERYHLSLLVYSAYLMTTSKGFHFEERTSFLSASCAKCQQFLFALTVWSPLAALRSSTVAETLSATRRTTWGCEYCAAPQALKPCVNPTPWTTSQDRSSMLCANLWGMSSGCRKKGTYNTTPSYCHRHSHTQIRSHRRRTGLKVKLV